MAAVGRLLGLSAKVSPPPHEGDIVYPVYMLDSMKSIQNIILAWTLCFNDVLDEEKLHNSLCRLLEMGDWRKVGGRLRSKENGKLEIHVPQEFTPERPAVSYHHQRVEMNMKDHPLAKNFPRATKTPSIQTGPQEFLPFTAHESAPTTFQDFITGDTPQLSLFVTSFNDATLVGLSWPHILMDVMGHQALVRSWCLVLAGHDNEVPDFLGAREDKICAIADESVENGEPYKLEPKLLNGLSMAKFGFWFVWRMIRTGPMEQRTICLPKSIVAKLRFEAQKDVAEGNGAAKEVPFMSDGDILTAWAIRAVALSLPQLPPITALHAANARFRLQALVQAPGVYVQNMAFAAFTFLSPEVASGPLGPIALENRRSLAEQLEEQQVLANLRILRSKQNAGQDPMVVGGDTNALLMPITNWTKGDFWNVVDFSPAVVRAGEAPDERTNPPGTITFQHAGSLRENRTMRHVVNILGKDRDGNYWITGALLPVTWAKIRQEISNM